MKRLISHVGSSALVRVCTALAACALVSYGPIGCGRAKTAAAAGASHVQGLSSSGKAANVAVMVEGSLQEAGNDMRILSGLLGDASAHYNFKLEPTYNATVSSAAAAIGAGAEEVGADGTLFIYLGGHGSPDGGAQMNDGGLLYYSAVQQALTSHLTRPLKRLVLVIFGCYSGSWINNIDGSGDVPAAALRGNDLATQQVTEKLGAAGALYQQLLVMTSSNAYEDSWYTPGGDSLFVDAFAKTFKSLAASPAHASIGDLIHGVQAGVSSSNVSYQAAPAAMTQELLFNQ